MSRSLTDSDRKSLIRLASKMPKGSPERKAILAGLKKSASIEGETFDLSTLISPDFGATEAGAWVDDVTYGKVRWRKGQKVRPYKAQVSGEIIGLEVVDPGDYKEALLGMASWKTENWGDTTGGSGWRSGRVPSLSKKVKLSNGATLEGVIFISNREGQEMSYYGFPKDGDYLYISVFHHGMELDGNLYSDDDTSETMVESSDYDAWYRVLGSPPSGLTATEEFGGWGVKPTTPRRDLKKAAAALEKLLSAASRIFSKAAFGG